jgi:hypothetical protein
MNVSRMVIPKSIVVLFEVWTLKLSQILLIKHFRFNDVNPFCDFVVGSLTLGFGYFCLQTKNIKKKVPI